MSDAKFYRDDTPVPAVADRCARAIYASADKRAKGMHPCKLHKDHVNDNTKHKCICDLEWDHTNSTPAKDI